MHESHVQGLRSLTGQRMVLMKMKRHQCSFRQTQTRLRQGWRQKVWVQTVQLWYALLLTCPPASVSCFSPSGKPKVIGASGSAAVKHKWYSNKQSSLQHVQKQPRHWSCCLGKYKCSNAYHAYSACLETALLGYGKLFHCRICLYHAECHEITSILCH